MNKSFFAESCGPVFCILCSLFCFLLSGCGYDPLLERTGTNYFPFAQENTWVYLQTCSQDTVTLKVMGTEPLLQREAWVLEYNGCPEYWWESAQEIDKFYCETIFVDGEEDTLMTCWLPWLQFPFVLNEKKNYKFEQRTFLLEDTILTTIQVDYEVVALRSYETVGLKSNDYEVKIKLTKSRKSQNFGSYDSSTIYYEWYRQNVGLTERTFNDTNEKLLSYSLH
ncbi:hypothetical protein KAW50_02950 [candidate division WOR-3 bacterium]|nr:hypothetical protein [candidate division WOR-3 bacterium]